MSKILRDPKASALCAYVQGYQTRLEGPGFSPNSNEGAAVRFIVDLYRFLIFILCGAVLIGVTIAVLSASTVETGINPNIFWPAVGLGIFVLVMTILSLGITATFISIHDRHAELAEDVSRLADAAEKLANR